MPEEKDDDTGPADDNRGYVMQYSMIISTLQANGDGTKEKDDTGTCTSSSSLPDLVPNGSDISCPSSDFDSDDDINFGIGNNLSFQNHPEIRLL